MSMDVDPGSVTCWIGQLKGGDREAARPILDRYYAGLVRLAREKLRSTRRTDADEEDAALSALASFFQGVDGGKFPVLSDRDDLGRLLVTITARKAYDRIEYNRAQLRSAGRTVDEGALAGPNGEGPGLGWIVGRESDPEIDAILREEYNARLDSLGDDELRRIALLKVQGYTSKEIGAAIDKCERTVATKLELIRKTWRRDVPDA